DLPPRPSLLFRTPLYVRVLIALAIGSLWGAMSFGKPLWLKFNEPLGQLGLLPVTLLRALAIPLIFFAILDGFVKTSIPLRRGAKLVMICAVNVSVAMCIGLLIMNTLQPAAQWNGKLTAWSADVHGSRKVAEANTAEHHK